MRMWLIRMWLGKSLALVRQSAGLYLSNETVYYVALHVIGWDLAFLFYLVVAIYCMCLIDLLIS